MLQLIDDGKKTLTVNLSIGEYINLHYFEALIKDSAVTKSDLDGNITYVNDNFVRITGYSKEELLGKDHRIIRHPNNQNETYESLWNTIREGKIWRDRILNRNKDGSDFWAETTIIPLIDPESGQVIEYIAIRRDITDFLKLQRQIHEQKIKAQKEKEISKAKDSFLILFSHELKTPLNAIINFSKYLLKYGDDLDKLPPKKVKNLLTRIEQSAQDMLTNVMQILELSRLKANKLQYNFTIFDSFEALQSVVHDHQPLAKEKGVDIMCNDFCELGKREKNSYLKSDEYRFKQIFANILSNAIKYSNGKVHLELKIKDNLWELHVEDNGPGIKDVEGAFDLFQRESESLNQGTKEGTGVGLTFVKYLCQDLGFEYRLGKSSRLGGLDFVLMKQEKEKNV